MIGVGEAGPEYGEDGTEQDSSAGLQKNKIPGRSYYYRRKGYGGLHINEARGMKNQERKKARLRSLVPDLSLEKQVLTDVTLEKTFSY